MALGSTEDITRMLNGIYDEVGHGSVDLANRIRTKVFEEIRLAYDGNEETMRGLMHRFVEVSIRHPLFTEWVADTGIHIQRLSAEQSWDLFAYWLGHNATVLRPPSAAELLRIGRNIHNMTASQGRCSVPTIREHAIVQRACKLYEEHSGIPLMQIIS